jgi:glycosyltransferase involved in cell wall biosynthesis
VTGKVDAEHRAPRVALLTNAPAPYRTQFLNELARRCNLLVVFDTKREPDREWVIDESEFVFDWRVSRGLMISRPHLPRRRFDKRVLHVPLNTFTILERFQPDVVVSGELGIRTMWAALYCVIRRRHLIAWWEGVPNSDGSGRLRTLSRTVLLRRASRYWGNGVESARSLAHYGVPRERVDLGMTAIDTGFWRRAVDDQRALARGQVREELALQGAVLLFVGELDSRKGVPELLQALTALVDMRDVPSWSMLLVGSGPLGAEVDRWALAHPKIPVVRTGFVQPTCMPKYYAAADIFVLASLEDPWGAVCLEALVAGLPQVTSSMVGSAADLVVSNEIGDIVDPGDPDGFALRLACRIRQAPALVPDSVRSDAAARWSPTAAATRGIAAIGACLRPEPHISAQDR